MPEKLDNERFKRVLNAWPEKAMKYLYEHYRPMLLRISERRTHNKIESEAIVQYAISRIWEKRVWIVKQKELRVDNYLVMITVKKSISYFRRASMVQKKLKQFAEALERFTVISEDAFNTRPEIGKIIWSIISGFPLREFQCLSLKYQHNMTIHEIGQELGITKKAVERSITAAYKRLRGFKDFLF